MKEETDYNVTDQKPLGLSDQIRAWRMSVNMSVEEVAKQISVRPQIIFAFEEGDYGIFPARVYAVGYLKRMTDHFFIPHGEDLISALKIEWEEKRGSKKDVIRPLPQSKRKKWYITPRRLLGLCGCVSLLFFVWLLIGQLAGFTGAPRLRIDEPHAHITVETPVVRIRGSTEKESQLTVNGREITMNSDGIFDEEIELISGVNTLFFLVQNRFGKSSEETRYVVVK